MLAAGRGPDQFREVTRHSTLDSSLQTLVTIYDIPVQTIFGAPQTLAPYRDEVMLIVNVASECGFTPQYAGLEALYLRHKDAGFVVLGFPCDQFAHQEPGSEDDIREFCTETYNVTFPMFGKIKVNGPETHPLYRLLKKAQPGLLGTTAIKWNFTKFLVGKDGVVRERFAPKVTPEMLESQVVAALGGSQESSVESVP